MDNYSKMINLFEKVDKSMLVDDNLLMLDCGLKEFNKKINEDKGRLKEVSKSMKQIRIRLLVDYENICLRLIDNELLILVKSNDVIVYKDNFDNIITYLFLEEANYNKCRAVDLLLLDTSLTENQVRVRTISGGTLKKPFRYLLSK